MRIAGLDIIGHPGFGNLALDFRGADGRAKSNIVIAGENGTGKSSVLSVIFNFLSSFSAINGRKSDVRFRIYFETEWQIKSNLLVDVTDEELRQNLPENWADFGGMVIYPTEHSMQLLIPSLHKGTSPTAARHPQAMPRFFDGTPAYGLSEANVSFDVLPVEVSNRTRNLELIRGGPEANPNRADANLGRQITQLLVDLQQADYIELGKWTAENPGSRPPAELGRRVLSLVEAFERIVPHKKYIGYQEGTGSGFLPLFKQGEFESTLDKFSNGEKQLLFRGAFIARLNSASDGAIALIDEPELSLHPSAQINILNFYNSVIHKPESNSGQIIIATHSPFVVHGSPLAKHIILKRDEYGRVYVDDRSSYPEASATEIAITAFEIGEFSSPKPIAIVVEGETDKSLIEIAWAKLRPGKAMPFAIVSAGGARRIQQLLGAGDQDGPLVGALSAMGVNCCIGLWDLDVEGYGQWNGTVKEAGAERSAVGSPLVPHRKRAGRSVWAAMLPVPPFRARYGSLDLSLAGQFRLTTELLFEDSFVEGLLGKSDNLSVPAEPFVEASTLAQKHRVVSAAQSFPNEAFAAFEPLLAFFEQVEAAGRTAA